MPAPKSGVYASFPLRTASGHIKLLGGDPPAYAGRNPILIYGNFGVFLFSALLFIRLHSVYDKHCNRHAHYYKIAYKAVDIRNIAEY